LLLLLLLMLMLLLLLGDNFLNSCCFHLAAFVYITCSGI
jgi:hypothetical protein